MPDATLAPRGPFVDRRSLNEAFSAVRAQTKGLVAGLSVEDQLLQTLPEASPTKWHLAHTSWFFDTFLLSRFDPDYRPYRPEFRDLFNSYYDAVGPQPARTSRSQSHPSLVEVLGYRAFVDERIPQLLERLDGPIGERLAEGVALGLQHEQQHQELILTDIKHALFQSPGRPSFGAQPVPTGLPSGLMRFVDQPEGIATIGAPSSGFAFDNERPRHRVFLEPHALGSRLVTNGEFREFQRDRGYRNPALWLAEGFALAHAQGWSQPLYWSPDGQSQFSLAGEVELDPAAPVAHLSYFEADAFAHWAGARLPTEAEWEQAAQSPAALRTEGNLLDSGWLAPLPLSGPSSGLAQLQGDAWEWTQSAYLPYPGFKPLGGAFGEYNGKFMINQMVLRGGSAFTPRGHLRPSYRNFFPPAARWQLAGLRLAKDPA